MDALNSGKHIRLGTMLVKIGLELGGDELNIQRDQTLPEPADFGLGNGYTSPGKE